VAPTHYEPRDDERELPMDGGHFDTLTRTLTAPNSRRRALATLLGGMLVPVLGLTDATAKNGKGKKKKNKKGGAPSGNCPTGTTTCGGACVDTQTNSDHCGGCGRPCVVQAPETCGTTGQCVAAACERYGQDPYGQGLTVCKGPQCSGSDFSFGKSYCDGSGNCVRFTGGNRACAPGRCDGTTGECTWRCALDSDCDPRAWCSDSRWCEEWLDMGEACSRGAQCLSRNCVDGTCCGTECEPLNSAVTCPLGICKQTCHAGWGNCSGHPTASGCETDLQSHPVHCGGCNKPCSGPCGPNNSGTKECAGGACFCTL
jgi:hypothetical protein